MKKFYDKYSWLIILLLVVALVFLKNCTPEPKPIQTIDLKPELIRQDSFRTVIKYHDSTRISVLNRYRTITQINDSTPCYTEIKFIKDACDTVIKVDSVLIGSLYGQVKNDSIIQIKQGQIITQKTDSIKDLKKQVRNQKIKTKLILAGWLIRESVGVGANLSGHR